MPSVRMERLLKDTDVSVQAAIKSSTRSFSQRI